MKELVPFFLCGGRYTAKQRHWKAQATMNSPRGPSRPASASIKVKLSAGGTNTQPYVRLLHETE